MNAEILDIFIISTVFVLTLVVVFQWLKKAWINRNKKMCAGCSEANKCAIDEKQKCGDS